MNRKRLLVLFILLAFATSFFASVFHLVPFVHASGENWLTGWSCRKSLLVSNASGAGTNYQIPIIVVNGTGLDIGITVYENNTANNDWTDLRFTGSDGSTLLNAWNQTQTNGVDITCWIEISDDLSSASTTIYLYYGNSTASAYWSGADTFVLFDDFNDASLNTTLWNTNGNPSESGGYLTCEQHGTENEKIYSKTSYGSAYAIYARGYLTSSPGQGETSLGWNNDIQDSDSVVLLTYATDNYYSETTNATVSGNSYDMGIISSGNYWLISIMWKDNTQVSFWVDGSAIINGTDAEAIPTGTYPIELYSRSLVGYWQDVASLDWICLRKYVDPEPTCNMWGSEETPPIVNVVSSPELHAHFNLTVGTEQNLTALSYPSLGYDGTLEAQGDNYTEIQTAQYADQNWNAINEMVIGQNYAAIVIPPYYIYRSYLYFDTSAIPSWANITGANISINIESKQIATSNFNITIQKGDTGFPHIPLQLYDYAHDNYTGGDGGYLDTTGLGIGYRNISLNDVGISCIGKGGTSRFCLRSDHDINASAPSDPEYLMFFATESSYPPLLYVSYQNLGTPIITYNTTTYTTPHSFSLEAGNYSFICVDLSLGPFGNLTWIFNSWIITTTTTNDTIVNPTITLNISETTTLTMYYLASYYLPPTPFTIPAHYLLLGKILDLMGCFGIIALSYSHIKNLKTGLRAFLITMFTAVVFFIVMYLMVSLEAYAV